MARKSFQYRTFSTFHHTHKQKCLITRATPPLVLALTLPVAMDGNSIGILSYELSVSDLKLAANEYVTDFKLIFGTVEPGFHETEAPYILARVLDTLEHETRIVNKADAGGKCRDEWAYDTDSWVTIAQAKPKKPLPKTGF